MVGGAITILKNHGLRQWAWDYISHLQIYDRSHKIPWFQTTKHFVIMIPFAWSASLFWDSENACPLFLGPGLAVDLFMNWGPYFCRYCILDTGSSSQYQPSCINYIPTCLMGKIACKWWLNSPFIDHHNTTGLNLTRKLIWFSNSIIWPCSFFPFFNSRKDVDIPIFLTNQLQKTEISRPSPAPWPSKTQAPRRASRGRVRRRGTFGDHGLISGLRGSWPRQNGWFHGISTNGLQHETRICGDWSKNMTISWFNMI